MVLAMVSIVRGKIWPRLFSSISSILSAASCSVSSDGKKLKLACDDEPERRYFGAWLRHNCRCPVCLPPIHEQNIVHHSNLIDLKITEASIEGSNVLVNWNSKAGPHSCTFAIDWLKQHDYTTPSVQEERVHDQEPIIAKSLPTMEYEQLTSSLEGYYEWMKQLNSYGMSLVQNVPLKDNMVFVKITDKIAPPSQHVYDLVFDVEAHDGSGPADASYTTDDLLLHSDQNFFESPPGIEILLCLQFDECVKGGESVLVDMYPVVQELREKHPKHFEVLTRVPYIAFRQHKALKTGEDQAVSFKYSVPHISLDYYGRINSLNWSPQFHHPLIAAEQDVEDYYEAFTLLSTMFEDSPLKVVHRLKPGEAIVVNNRRFLHSRTAFELNGGGRHLKGHYISCDYFCSQLRVLSQQLNKKDPIKMMFTRSHAY